MTRASERERWEREWGRVGAWIWNRMSSPVAGEYWFGMKEDRWESIVQHERVGGGGRCELYEIIDEIWTLSHSRSVCVHLCEEHTEPFDKVKINFHTKLHCVDLHWPLVVDGKTRLGWSDMLNNAQRLWNVHWTHRQTLLATNHSKKKCQDLSTLFDLQNILSMRKETKRKQRDKGKSRTPIVQL